MILEYCTFVTLLSGLNVFKILFTSALKIAKIVLISKFFNEAADVSFRKISQICHVAYFYIRK